MNIDNITIKNKQLIENLIQSEIQKNNNNLINEIIDTNFTKTENEYLNEIYNDYKNHYDNYLKKKIIYANTLNNLIEYLETSMLNDELTDSKMRQVKFEHKRLLGKLNDVNSEINELQNK